MRQGEEDTKPDLYDVVSDMHHEVFREGKDADPATRDTALAGVRSAEPTTRWLSLDLLGAVGLAEDAEVVRSKLRDKDRFVRMSAVKALGDILGREAEPEITKACDDEDPYVRREAYLTAGEVLGESVIPFLEAQIVEEDRTVAESGLFGSLVLLGRTEHLGKLAELARDGHPQVRSAARKYLCKAGFLTSEEDDAEVDAFISGLDTGKTGLGEMLSQFDDGG